MDVVANHCCTKKCFEKFIILEELKCRFPKRGKHFKSMHLSSILRVLSIGYCAPVNILRQNQLLNQ